MSSKEYLLAILERNGINLIASGYSQSELTLKLQESLKMWLIANDMFKNISASSDPAFFVNESKKLLNDSISEDKLKTFNLSAMGGVFEGTKKISELVSKNNTSDSMKHWAYLWQMAKESENAGGVLGEIPSIDELRWLVTDGGFYITNRNPSLDTPKTLEDSKNQVHQFISHFDIAIKFGAPAKTLKIIASIVKNLLSKYNESQGIYSHLSIDELEVMLQRREGVEMANKAMGTNFVVKGLSAQELRGIIDFRKSSGDSLKTNFDGFVFSQNLIEYIKNV